MLARRSLISEQIARPEQFRPKMGSVLPGGCKGWRGRKSQGFDRARFLLIANALATHRELSEEIIRTVYNSLIIRSHPPLPPPRVKQEPK